MPLMLPTARWSLTPPFHPYPCRHGRSVFCGAFPRVSPAGRYPAPSFCGVRTFLAAQGHAAIQPSAQGIFMRSEAVGQRGIESHQVDGPLSRISYQDGFFSNKLMKLVLRSDSVSRAFVAIGKQSSSESVSPSEVPQILPKHLLYLYGGIGLLLQHIEFYALQE